MNVIQFPSRTPARTEFGKRKDFQPVAAMRMAPQHQSRVYVPPVLSPAEQFPEGYIAAHLRHVAKHVIEMVGAKRAAELFFIMADEARRA